MAFTFTKDLTTAVFYKSGLKLMILFSSLRILSWTQWRQSCPHCRPNIVRPSPRWRRWTTRYSSYETRMHCSRHREVGNWGHREVGNWGYREVGNWGHREVGNWGYREVGNWGYREVGNWGYREVDNWGYREVGNWGYREVGNWGHREVGNWGFWDMGDWRMPKVQRGNIVIHRNKARILGYFS